MPAATVVSPQEAPERLLERVQELQDRLDGTGDRATRELADALVSAVVQMYGSGLERILERLHEGGEAGRGLALALSEDPFLGTLLMIHDLHPVPLEDRVRAALDEVRPYMESHGGNVELLSISGGVARIHLRGSCSDCSASSVTLELAIKQALEQAAPDLEGLEVEGVAPQAVPGQGLPMATGMAGMELPVLQSGTPSWLPVAMEGEPPEGTMVARAVAGRPLLIANVEGTLLAYQDTCAGCGRPLRDGSLSAGVLSCAHCRRGFVLPAAGRSTDQDALQLEPVPLLREPDGVRVALET
jgi:Fe-S cluster biogenesis protein NfuA/nitrite reductase/ring-hydroxylating ferredoxin subunit